MEMDMNAIAYRDFDLKGARALEPAARPRTASPSRERDQVPRHGIIRRIFAAIERSAQRRAEREAGRFIAEHGGRITDDVERQLTARFAGRGFLPYTPPRSVSPIANLLAR
jgi:hypothetical protein